MSIENLKHAIATNLNISYEEASSLVDLDLDLDNCDLEEVKEIESSSMTYLDYFLQKYPKS